MDDIVKQAMFKWPNVPDCYDWLGLDARGNWYMRDEAAQKYASFQQACASREGGSPGKGSKLQHDKLIQFIARNYQADRDGRWYFQNGPQRVYVELEQTPWVYRVNSDATVETHTGLILPPTGALVDELGHVYVLTEVGVGLVHTQDVYAAAQAIEASRWPLCEICSANMPNRHGYLLSPATVWRICQPQ